METSGSGWGQGTDIEMGSGVRVEAVVVVVGGRGVDKEENTLENEKDLFGLNF